MAHCIPLGSPLTLSVLAALTLFCVDMCYKYDVRVRRRGAFLGDEIDAIALSELFVGRNLVDVDVLRV